MVMGFFIIWAIVNKTGFGRQVVAGVKNVKASRASGIRVKHVIMKLTFWMVVFHGGRSGRLYGAHEFRYSGLWGVE